MNFGHQFSQESRNKRIPFSHCHVSCSFFRCIFSSRFISHFFFFRCCLLPVSLTPTQFSSFCLSDSLECMKCSRNGTKCTESQRLTSTCERQHKTPQYETTKTRTKQAKKSESRRKRKMLVEKWRPR